MLERCPEYDSCLTLHARKAEDDHDDDDGNDDDDDDDDASYPRTLP